MTRLGPLLRSGSALVAVSALALTLSACGQALTPEDDPNVVRQTESALQWWNTYITYEHIVLGWHDTDLGVPGSTPVQLRHASRLINHGVYAWGYMPEFVDEVTGDQFRFIHLRPQHQYATHIGQTYPAGYIVGLSGGDTYDTGLGVYSTGAHLCVQTLVPFFNAFPRGSEGGGNGSNPPPSDGGATCHSQTLNRTVASGTCVQSAQDGRWYHCSNGGWQAGESGCSSTFGWCHSYTLNRWVAPRACVESKVDHRWYQCDQGWRAASNGAGPLGTCSAEYHL